MMSGSSHLFFLDRNKIPINLEIHRHYFDLSGKSGTVCLCLSWASVCWFDALLLQPTLSWTSLPSPQVDYATRYVSNWLLSLESPPVDYVAGHTGIHNITPRFNNLWSRRLGVDSNSIGTSRRDWCLQPLRAFRAFDFQDSRHVRCPQPL